MKPNLKIHVTVQNTTPIIYWTAHTASVWLPCHCNVLCRGVQSVLAASTDRHAVLVSIRTSLKCQLFGPMEHEATARVALGYTAERNRHFTVDDDQTVKGAPISIESVLPGSTRIDTSL